MGTKTTIRPIKAQDIGEVLDMVRGLANHHNDTATLTPEQLSRDALGPAPWLHILVAETAQTLVGYAALCPLAQLQFGVRGMDMHHLFVRASSRGTGIGRALIDASLVVATAQNCGYMTVGTHPDNTAAANVYLAAGFDRLDPPGPRFRIKL
ncbi:MAG: GNAT family N-acetyltransferase [Sulfitobacter sp.]